MIETKANNVLGRLEIDNVLVCLIGIPPRTGRQGSRYNTFDGGEQDINAQGKTKAPPFGRSHNAYYSYWGSTDAPQNGNKRRIVWEIGHDAAVTTREKN